MRQLWADLVPVMKADTSLRWWVVEAEGRPDSLAPALKCLDVLRKWTS